MSDFRIINCGSVMQVEALSPAARELAEESFPVESWMGSPTCFTTDWRAARNLGEQLLGEGWQVDWRV